MDVTPPDAAPPDAVLRDAVPRKVEVTVEELVLELAGPGAGAAWDPEAVGEAVRRALVQLFAERGAGPFVPGSAPVVDAGEVHVAEVGAVEAVGASVAEAVYRGLASTTLASR